MRLLCAFGLHDFSLDPGGLPVFTLRVVCVECGCLSTGVGVEDGRRVDYIHPPPYVEGYGWGV